jgi:hypothetical protein
MSELILKAKKYLEGQIVEVFLDSVFDVCWSSREPRIMTYCGEVPK